MAGREPKYQRVIDWVKENIASGNLKYGDRMMSEKELAEKFGLSRQTIRHATGELVNQHLVTRVQGSGTYIGGSYQSVREKKYMNVAVISTYSDSYIFPPTLKGIGNVLVSHHYTMQLFFTDNKVDKEEEILKSILEKDDVDGLIVEPARSALPNPNLHYYREIQGRHIPIIFFNAQYPEIEAPCVRIDDAGIARRATELLIRNGHRRIGAIFDSDDGQGRLRYQGYLEAIRAAGLELHEKDMVWADTPEIHDLEMAGAYILHRLDDCTGVICYNDEVACQLVNIALKNGMSLPRDLSVVGIDDADLAEICPVPLTTFPHPKGELGKKVAENLLQMIENPEFDGSYLFHLEPVIRSSVYNLNF